MSAPRGGFGAAHWAKVTHASPLLIRPRGSVTSAPALALSGYSPVVNDEVAYVLLDQRTLLVLGKPVAP